MSQDSAHHATALKRVDLLIPLDGLSGQSHGYTIHSTTVAGVAISTGPFKIETPEEKLTRQITALKREGCFEHFRNALYAADSNHDGLLSYDEFSHAKLNAPEQTMLDTFKTELLDAYKTSQAPDFVKKLAASKELSSLNRVLLGHSLPAIDNNFPADIIRTSRLGSYTNRQR